MKALHPAHFKSCIYTFLILLLLMSQFAARAADEGLPDVLIWIDARTASGQWVSLTYPKVVKKEQAETHLGLLLRETGWKAEGVKISNGSVMESGENPMTSVEFVTAQAIRLDSGYLPIEPIVKAFRDLKRIEIQCMVSPSFIFHGLDNYENKHVKITLQRSESAFRYIIYVKNSNFESLGLPELNNQEQASGRGARSYYLLAFALVIILALLSAVLVYAVTARLVGKRG